MTRLACLAIGGAVLAACAPVGPSTDPGTPLLPATFVSGDSAPLGAVTMDPWWRDLNDALLTSMVERGLQSSLDIAQARSRIVEAEAAARAIGAAGGSLAAESTARGGDGQATTRSDSVTLTGTLAIDLFGGDYRQREAALASLRAAELDAGTARLAYLSAIVTNYINARYYQNAGALARSGLTAREQTLALVRGRHAQGLATELELAQAQAALDTARADIPAYDMGFEASAYAIATLLAEPTARVLADMQRGASQPRASGPASAGVPADLLLNRPDVASARAAYVAALAAVGVSEAAMRPALSLGGTITASGATGWSLGPSLILPVFNQGALAANRDAAAARAVTAGLAWQSSVNAAVDEVQAAQSGYVHNRRILANREAAAESQARAETLTREAWENGGEALSTLITAQLSTTSTRSAAAGAARDAALAWMRLQIAVGRGWEQAGELVPAAG